MINPKWEVIVGNVGTAYQGDDEAEAKEVYKEYVEISENQTCNRAYGESVALFLNGDILHEHSGFAMEEPEVVVHIPIHLSLAMEELKTKIAIEDKAGKLTDEQKEWLREELETLKKGI